MTIHTSVAAARLRLREAGIPPVESDLDARLLAQHALGWTTEQFFTDASAPEPDGFGPRYEVEGILITPDGRRPRLRSVWQVDEGQLAPRLITAYPLEP